MKQYVLRRIALAIPTLIPVSVIVFAMMRLFTGGVVCILAPCVPCFGVAGGVVVLPVRDFRWPPVWTDVPLTVDPAAGLKIMLVPPLVFGLARAGPIMRIMRSALLDVLRQDYIRTAWSKGLPERAIVLRHALKNALIPVVSLIGLQTPLYIGGDRKSVV